MFRVGILNALDGRDELVQSAAGAGHDEGEERVLGIFANLPFMVKQKRCKVRVLLLVVAEERLQLHFALSLADLMLDLFFGVARRKSHSFDGDALIRCVWTQRQLSERQNK